MLAIVVSEADSASVHIGEHLRDIVAWDHETDDSRPLADGGGEVLRTDGMTLRTFETRHLDIADAAAAFEDPDLLVFASKHAGSTDEFLTAHHTGNFGPADHGGADGELARTCPNAHRRVVQALAEHAPSDYEAGMEATHHGPSEVGVPSMFVELGSDEAQWDDPDGARAVARAIVDLRDVSADTPRENGHRRQIVGFGGGHYAPRFERIVRETDWAVGHVAADWCLEAMGDPAENRDVIRQAFEQSASEFGVVADDRPELQTVIEDLGYRVVSERWLRETTGVALSLVDRVETELGRVEDGVRFGAQAAEAEGELTFTALPEGLCDAAQRVDTDRAWDLVAERTVAFETIEGATRLGARVALSTPAAHQRIVEALAELLGEQYDSVEVTDGAVLAHEQTFDPEKARTLGISEGPAFGKLSAGQSVEIQGRTIDPDVVHTEREHRFPLDAPEREDTD